MSVSNFWLHGDALNLALAALLLALSVATWVVAGWKWRLLQRVRVDVPRSIAAVWQAPSLQVAHERLEAFDRDACVWPLLAALQPPLQGTLGHASPRQEQVTRCLRDALQVVVERLQWGQTFLATTAAAAPFVGLLGTVWGIFNALSQMGHAGPLAVDQMAGPVGEALAMTALGLAVAIPAMLAYNLLGRRIALLEAQLEGFAYDVRAMLADSEA